MAALTLAGTNIRTANAIFFDLVSGYFEPPEVRGSDDVIPAADGRTIRNRVVDRRRITLEGYIQGSSASDWRTKTQAFFALCDPTTPVSMVIADAYLGSTGSPTITVRFINAIGGTPTGIAGVSTGPAFQTWSVELESVTPDWA